MGVKVEMLETLQDLKAVHSNIFVYEKVAMLALCTLVWKPNLYNYLF